MGLFKKGRIWYVAIRKNGTNIVKSTGASNKKLAQEIYEHLLTEIVRGKFIKREKSRTTSFAELWERYKTRYERQRDIYTIKHLLRHFGEKKLYDIQPEDVEDYIHNRLRETPIPSHATVYKEYALGRRLFNVGRKTWKLVEHNPFSDFDCKEMLDTDNPRVRCLTVQEELALLDVSTPQLRDYITFAIHTGCRTGEILSCTWAENVDIFNRVLKVRISKRLRNKNKMKIIPMSDTLYKTLLNMYRVQNISGLLFQFTRGEVRYQFEKSAKKAGIKDVRPHDFRRTFSSRLLDKGVPIYEIKVLLGHETQDVTEKHYAHHGVEKLRQSVRLLDEYYEADTGNIHLNLSTKEVSV